MKWRELSGVLCDNRMPVRVKGKAYKIINNLIYGSECWPIKQAHATKIHAAEMRMLRWAGGVTLADKVRNTHIRGSFKIRPIEEKLSERRHQWYGHVMRRPEEHMTKRVLAINSGPKKRGRPLQTWMSVINKDLKKAQVNDSTTRNRCLWRRMTRRADPK
ncbi:uncharacterized protein LOC123701180 [Colias croceus]|uniref:uncharacterized protein LOC123701180 n=1 Tax=Colias crocea TaxID=72248 RepID=UPI001E27EF15|nr:uncharacterized protein LOC123701180 [Colias croceus]